MEVFTQFSSDLDPTTKELLTHGHVLMEVLKQPLEHPLSMCEQVLTLAAANGKAMNDIPRESVKEFQMGYLEYMESEHKDITDEISVTMKLDDDLMKRILDCAQEYKVKWQEQKKSKTA